MREKVALNETGLRLWGLVGRGGVGSEAMEGARAKAGGDASSEDAKGQYPMGRVRPFWPSNGDGPRRGVGPGALEIATVGTGRSAGWLTGFCRGG